MSPLHILQRNAVRQPHFEYSYTFIWESSDIEQKIPHPIKDFQLYRRFANITRQSDKRKSLTVPLQVTSKCIVLEIRDHGGCRTLYSAKVSYKVCIENTVVGGTSEDVTLVYLSDTVSLSWAVKCEQAIIQEYRIKYFSVDYSSDVKTLITRNRR